jgi:hypothetical protein
MCEVLLSVSILGPVFLEPMSEEIILPKNCYKNPKPKTVAGIGYMEHCLPNVLSRPFGKLLSVLAYHINCSVGAIVYLNYSTNIVALLYYIFVYFYYF